MRVLVTGGAGFLGSHLCEELLRRTPGIGELLVVDDLSSGSEKNLEAFFAEAEEQGVDADIIVHDVATVQMHPEYFDIIVHAASPASPVDHQRDAWATISANLLGAKNVLRFLRPGGRILFTSTSEVYGDPAISPQPEAYTGSVHINGPRAPYDEGKRCTEALLSNLGDGTQVRIARIFNTYGPRMRPSDGRVISSLVTQALAGRPLSIYGDGSQGRSFCWVGDTARGLVDLLLADRPALQALPVNIGNPNEISIMTLAAQICGIVPQGDPEAWRQRLEYHPLPQDDPMQRCPDISRARDLLGWEPEVSWAEGLELVVDYFKSREA